MKFLCSSLLQQLLQNSMLYDEKGRSLLSFKLKPSDIMLEYNNLSYEFRQAEFKQKVFTQNFFPKVSEMLQIK